MKNLIMCACVLLLFTYCKREVIVIPEACLQSDTTEVTTNEQITFTDCSKNAQSTWVHIYTPGKKPLKYNGNLFDANRKYTHTFAETGDFIAVLTALGGNGSPVDTAFVNVKVVP